MTIVATQPMIHFPSEQTIHEFLIEQHLTIEKPLREVRTQKDVDESVAHVYQAVAKVFAHRSLTENTLNDEIHEITYHFQADLRLVRDSTDISFRKALASSMLDCAERSKEEATGLPRPPSQEDRIVEFLVEDRLTKKWLSSEKSAMKVYRVVAKLLIAPMFLGKLDQREFGSMISWTTKCCKEELEMSKIQRKSFQQDLSSAVTSYVDRVRLRDCKELSERKRCREEPETQDAATQVNRRLEMRDPSNR